VGVGGCLVGGSQSLFKVVNIMPRAKLDSFPSFFDNTKLVFNPIIESNRITTIGQLKETNRVVDEIINNLSDQALLQMMGGTGNDLDKLIQTIYEETYNVLYGNMGIIKDSTFAYLDKLTESVEEAMRVENISYFILSTMPEFELNWHHLEWGQFVMRHNKLGILAARDLGKSYYFSNAYCIWKMYRYKVLNKFEPFKNAALASSQRGYIVTNSEDLGIDLLEILKNNIENNDELARKLLPAGEGRKEGWGGKSIKCRNGTRLGVKSYGSAFRGRHPGYIVVDDFLKDNVIYSSTQREKATNWFHSVLMNAVSKVGQTCVVGTPFSSADLYGDLKTKKMWKVFEYPAIYPDGRVTWSSRYDFQDIMNKREEQGSLIFSREILCRPIVSDSSIFPHEILLRSLVGMTDLTLVNNRESYGMKFEQVITGCDFAMSASVGSDYSVFTTWGVTEAQEMYLMNVWRGQGKSFAEQIAVLKYIYSNFRPDVMVLEANQFQRIFVDEADRHGLPVVPHVTTGANKHDLRKGVPGLAILFERMKIKFPQGDEYSRAVTELIHNEFLSVTFTSDHGIQGVGSNDDCVMSVWMGSIALRKATTSILGFLED